MPCHVAILMPAYLRLVLEGDKTIESRLTRTAVPPFRAVTPGERIYFKASGGPFMATATAGPVHYHDDLTPEDVDTLRRRFNDRVRGEPAYWHAKRNSRYATFIELRDVTPCDLGPAYPKSAYRAWFVLPDAAEPVLDVRLTGGAIRNRYVCDEKPLKNISHVARFVHGPAPGQPVSNP